MIENIPLLKPPVEVRPSKIHRYGVFATRKISAGEIIEECPVIVVKKPDLYLLNYWFRWQQNPEHENRSALALGYGSLYNHTTNSNAEFICDYERQLIIIKAKREILSGDEIFVYYADHWFEVRGIKEIKPRTKFRETLSLLAKVVIVVGIIFLFKYFGK